MTAPMTADRLDQIRATVKTIDAFADGDETMMTPAESMLCGLLRMVDAQTAEIDRLVDRLHRSRKRAAKQRARALAAELAVDVIRTELDHLDGARQAGQAAQ